MKNFFSISKKKSSKRYPLIKNFERVEIEIFEIIRKFRIKIKHFKKIETKTLNLHLKEFYMNIKKEPEIYNYLTNKEMNENTVINNEMKKMIQVLIKLLYNYESNIELIINVSYLLMKIN